MFQTYEEAKIEHILGMILGSKIQPNEAKAYLKGLWIIWFWTASQFVECVFQLIWWIKLLKIVDYERKVENNGDNQMIEDGVEDEDGMVYQRNNLNPSKFNFGIQKKKSMNLGMFGDSDSDEDGFNMSTSPLSSDMGELNSLDSTLDSLSKQVKSGKNGPEMVFSENRLRNLSSRLAKLEAQMQAKADKLETEIRTDKVFQEDESTPKYSKEHMLERLRQEQEDDLLGLSEVKKQQKLLLANQRVTKKSRKRKSKSKKQKRDKKSSKSSKKQKKAQIGPQMRPAEVTKIKQKMEESDTIREKSKVEIDF